MSRRSNPPENRCAQCRAPIVVCSVNGRYRACDPELIAVVNGETGSVVRGYKVHKCATKAPKRKAKAVETPRLPLGEDQQPQQEVTQ